MKMGIRSAVNRKPNETMRLIITTFVGIVFGFFIGVSFPTLSLTKLNLPSSILPIDFSYGGDQNAQSSVNSNNSHSTQAQNLTATSKLNLSSSILPIDISYGGDRNVQSSVNSNNSHSTQAQNLTDTSKIWVPFNPRGAERLPPGIVEAESDFYLQRLWGKPNEDLTSKPQYLVTFTVGYNQRMNIDAAVKKFSGNFTILLFHYDGRTTEWDEFQWSKRAIHVSVHQQTKWWYAKRFLHPDIVAPYDYIFIWDEDLGVENFNAEEYIKIVRKHGLEISQPGLEPNKQLTWRMTKRRVDQEVHKVTEEKRGRCKKPHLPPCAEFVEIMAPVFSRDAWRCVWHMIQNDFVHGWGLDFTFRKCVEPAHEKMGVVDSQWIVHQTVPSLGNQGEAQNGKAPWLGIRKRCEKEGTIFKDRFDKAEKDYYKAMGIDFSKSSAHNLLRSLHKLVKFIIITCIIIC